MRRRVRPMAPAPQLIVIAVVGGVGCCWAALSRATRSCRMDSTIPVVSFGDRSRVAGERLAGRHLGVDRIALAAPTARVSVRAVDLDDLNAVGVKVADESGGVGAGRLDADNGELSQLLQPGEQRPVALRAGRESSGPEQATALVERGGVMGIGVRVDATGDTR